jgi:hypothetical protein
MHNNAYFKMSCRCDYGPTIILGMFIMLIVFAVIEFCRAIWGKKD